MRQSCYPVIHLILARCKDNVWYVGGLNGTNEVLNLSFNLDFLKKGSDYKMTLFQDGKESHLFSISKKTISSKTLRVSTLPRGGFVAVFRKK